MVHYESFNNKLNEFFDDLVQTFPEVGEFKTMKLGLGMARNVNVTLPQSMFTDHVLKKYEAQIRNRDEEFFMKHDYNDVMSNIQMFNTGFSMDIVGQLKEIWKDLSKENKETIWKYLNVLVVLCQRCIKP